MKAASLNKRSWKPFLMKDSGKWYTGHDNVWSMFNVNNPLVIESEDAHEIRTLKLTLTHAIRGRNLANMYFEDEEGFSYSMSLDGGLKLIKKMLKDEISRDGEYLIADFVQVKRGVSLLIEAV